MGYKPRIQRAAGIYDMPLPIAQVSESFTRRVSSTEIPLQAGVLVGTTRRGAAQVQFSGMIVVQNPQDDDRADGMVYSTGIEKTRLTEWLLESDEPFTFYRYIKGAVIGGTNFHDELGTRFYRNCLCTQLDFAHSNQSNYVLPYSFTLLVPDGTEWYDEEPDPTWMPGGLG